MNIVIHFIKQTQPILRYRLTAECWQVTAEARPYPPLTLYDDADDDDDDSVPTQVLLSDDKEKPVSQLQVYEPAELLHRCWHPPLDTKHSFTSVKPSHINQLASGNMAHTELINIEKDDKQRKTRIWTTWVAAQLSLWTKTKSTRTKIRTITKTVRGGGAYARSPQVQCVYELSRLSVPSIVAWRKNKQKDKQKKTNSAP